MVAVLRGNFSKFTHESKFIENINTEKLAEKAKTEGDELRNKIKGKRILLDLTQKDSRDLLNAFRL